MIEQLFTPEQIENLYYCLRAIWYTIPLYQVVLALMLFTLSIILTIILIKMAISTLIGSIIQLFKERRYSND